VSFGKKISTISQKKTSPMLENKSKLMQTESASGFQFGNSKDIKIIQTRVSNPFIFGFLPDLS